MKVVSAPGDKLNELIQREIHTLMFELKGIKGVVHLREALIYKQNIYSIMETSHCLFTHLVRRYKEQMQGGFS